MSKNHHLTVYKSNKVVEAGYKLSLNEQRLILCCIAKVNPTKPLTADENFEVTAKEFATQFEISEDKAYQTLKEISEQLFERYVIIDNPDPRDKTLKYTKTRWISAIHYHIDAGKISVMFAPMLIPYLSQLTGNFTFYHLNQIGEMSSIYAIRLYELLMQWKTTGKREIEIDSLKQQFELDDSYSRMNNFKARVIVPAVEEINVYSNYKVSWTQRKTGRKVTHLIFEFSEKQPEKLVKPKPKIKSTPQTSEKSAGKIDNLQHFAKLHKQYGESADAAIPEDIKELLKAQ